MLADRIGARRVLVRIVLWWSLFTALTGQVSSFGWLLVVRFCFGAGEAGAYPSASSSISRWFPAAERSFASGVVWMASRVGGMLSPILVVPLQQAYGWRVAFYPFGAVGVVWCAVWWSWYRDRPQDQPRIPAAELARIPAAPPAHAAGLPWRRVLRQANFWKLLAMYHCYCWGAYFYMSWLHTYLQKGRGFTEDQMKLWSCLPFLLGALANLAGGRLSDALVARRGLRFGRRVVGGTGLALSAVFLVLTSLAPTPVMAAVFLCLGFAAMDAFLPVAWAVSLDIGLANAGSVSGAMNMAGQAGSFVSSVAFGYLVTAFGSYDRPLLPLALMTGVAAVLFFRIDPTQPLVPDDGARA